MSKRKINTTYLTLASALKEYGMKWSEDQVEDFLAKCEKDFFTVKRLPRSMRVVKNLLEENVEDTHQIERLVSGEGIPTRTVTKNCNWDCDFMPLCKGELYGQNVEHIRKSQYEPRTNTHAGVVEQDD